jgi:hypothetical protein
MEFRKLQSLVELDLSNCSQLGCLPDSIMDLSQLKTFRLSNCHQLEVLLILLIFKAKVTYYYNVVADSDIADLGTCLEHHPTLELAALSSVNFHHNTALGPRSKGRLGVQFHS